MKDPVEAGRWYFLCDSADPEAAEAIRRFITANGSNSQHAFSQLPGRSRWRTLAECPPPAAARLRELGFQGMRTVAPRQSTYKEWLSVVLGSFAVLFFISFFVIGVLTAIGWIRT